MKNFWKFFKLCSFIVLALCLGGVGFGLFQTKHLSNISATATAGIALEGEVQNGNTLNISVKPKEEVVNALSQTLGVTYASAADMTLPESATELTVDFMRQFSAVASQITNISLGEGVTVLGDAYYDEAKGRYIGVFDGFTALETIDMPDVTQIGSYSFSGCDALTTVTGTVNKLTIGNFALRNTTQTYTYQNENLKEVIFDGTWGSTMGAGDVPNGGITQADIRTLPYTTVAYIAFEDKVNVREQALLGCTSLQVVDATRTLKFDFSSVDALQENLFTLILSSSDSIYGQPLNFDSTNYAMVDHVYSYMLSPATDDDSDVKYFTFLDAPYIQQAEGAPYLFKYKNLNNITQLYTTLGYGALSASAQNGVLTAITPTYLDGSLMEDVSVLYIPTGFLLNGVTGVTSLNINWGSIANNGVEEDCFKNITKIVVSGEFITVERLYDAQTGGLVGPDTYYMPNLTDIVLCDGIQNISACFAFADLDDLTQLQNIYLPNTATVDENLLWFVSDGISFFMNEGGTGNLAVSSDGKRVLSADGTKLYIGDGSGIIEESVKTIKTHAFAGKQGLQELVIPSHITRIESYSFSYSNLQTITFEEGSQLKEVPQGMFAGLAYLTEVILPYGIISIGERAFEYCSSLTNVSIPDTVQSIGAYSFEHLENLQTVIIGKNSQLQTIGNSAFYDCVALTSIIVPANITSIGTWAFRDCKNLQTVTNYSSLSLTAGSTDNGYVACYATQVFTVDAQTQTLTAFSGSVTEVEIPDGILVVGERTFESYAGLEKLSLPSSLISIESYAFSNTFNNKSLVEVLIPENSILENIGDYAFDYSRELQSIFIPDTVINIGASAFQGCKLLETVNISENSQMETIGEDAFSGCESLTSIVIPKNITVLSDHVFYGCSVLKEVTILEDSALQTIKQYAFYNCEFLFSITLPKGVVNIEENAFYGCFSLCIIFNYSGLSLVAGNFDYGYVACYANYIGDGTGLELVDNVHWVDTINQMYVKYVGNESIVYIPDGVRTIGQMTFVGNTVIEQVVIPSSVTLTQRMVFAGCSSLRSVLFDGESSLQVIGEMCFSNTALTSFVVPASVTQIGGLCFNGCNNLTSVTFENTSGWFVSTNSTATSGTNLNVTNPTQNVTYLTSTYGLYYWKRS